MHGDLNAGSLEPHAEAPVQLQKFNDAIRFSSSNSLHAAVSPGNVATLLAGMCHPHPAARMTAAAAANIMWLKEGADVPLPMCPEGLDLS